MNMMKLFIKNLVFLILGIVSVHNLFYSNYTNDKTYKPSGTTIKPEECVPESRYSKEKRSVPLCESHPNASCPPSCYEVCGKSDDSQKPNDKKPSPPYWKILATLIIAGVAIYAVLIILYHIISSSLLIIFKII